MVWKSPKTTLRNSLIGNQIVCNTQLNIYSQIYFRRVSLSNIVIINRNSHEVTKYQWLQDKGSIYLFWKKFWSIWSLGSRHWTLKYSEKVMLKSLSLIFKTSEMWISMPICRISERISYIVSPLFRNKSKISFSFLFIIVFMSTVTIFLCINLSFRKILT